MNDTKLDDNNELLVEQDFSQNNNLLFDGQDKSDEVVNNEVEEIDVSQAIDMRRSKTQDYERVKQRLQDEYIQSIMAQRRKNTIQKPYHTMNEAERKTRIKQLWGKVRMYVRLRNSLNSIKVDMELNELN